MLAVLGASGGLGKGLLDYLNASPLKIEKYGKVQGSFRADLDVEDEQSVESFVKRLDSDAPAGEPIYIINAIGVSLNGFCHKMSLSDFEKTIKVNLTGSFLLLKYLQPILKSRPGSSIVFLSSIVGEVGVPGTIAYAASKSSLRGLVRTAGKEFARFSSTVNAIELGYFEKGMIEQIPADQLGAIVQQIPLNKLGTISDLYGACDFALKNSFLTGSVIKLNGGMA